MSGSISDKQEIIKFLFNRNREVYEKVRDLTLKEILKNKYCKKAINCEIKEINHIVKILKKYEE